jgi:hypothetical protein
MIQHYDRATSSTPALICRDLRNRGRGRAPLSFFARLAALAILGTAILSFPGRALAQQAAPVARWSFDNAAGPTVRDAVSGTEDNVGGFYKYVPGVSGSALRFDGYTTSVVRKAENAPRLHGSFSVEAWIAFDTYPWNWLPVIDQEQDRQSGYFFGVDALGHVSLQVSVEGVWQTATSTAQISLKKWAHIAGTYDENRALTVYLDGSPVATQPVRGAMLPAPGQDLLIGRVREPLFPFPSFSISPHEAVWYSLDGILDEIAIYDRSLSAEEVQQAHASAHARAGEVIPWPVLPSGPPGAGPFGAFYATLKFEDTWDRIRRMGPDTDVVVRFDSSPTRLVFWQGTGYIPTWATENGTWYTDEFLEAYASGCPDQGDCEPMSDKQDRYSHVNIVESSEARAVVHWRYALAEVTHYLGADPDPLTGWTDWVDEYWTVYPDGVAIRKQVLRPTDLNNSYEWQETIIINPPGRSPDDDINLDALTIGNMKGETATYTWQPKPLGVFGWIRQPEKLDKPDNPNIQLVNLKSTWKPFQIVSPVHSRIKVFSPTQTVFNFGCWNHWPITQIPSSGRYCVAADRASHGSLTHIFWDDYERTESSITKILMDGLTTKSAAELLPLAKSWLSAPRLEIEGDAFQSEGYDEAQRAFVVSRKTAGKPAALALTLRASDSSPLVNPAIVIKNWGDAAAQLKINGKPVNWGKDFRRGYVKKLDGADLVVWIRQEAITPVQIALTPER